MNRREFLQCAALLAAGGPVTPWALSDEQQAFIAARPHYVERRKSDLFNSIERRTVELAAERILPATDTPGALDAGVPRFIELMVDDWFTEAERSTFIEGLDGLVLRSGGDFAELSSREQQRLLEDLEAEASDAPWYEIGNVFRMWDADAPFICQLKELTVLGFMLSHVGAEQFLRENPMGSFDGDIPLGDDESAYAAQISVRVIAKGI
jgi:gluconate 2-dehydrogenase gamma chain